MPKKIHAQNENATSIIQHNATKKNMLKTTHAEGNSCSTQLTINTTNKQQNNNRQTTLETSLPLKNSPLSKCSLL